MVRHTLVRASRRNHPRTLTDVMLDLNDLNDGLPGVTPALGSALAHAAAVCLELQGHDQGVPLSVTGDSEKTYRLVWPEVDDQARRTWADSQEATEKGATAIAMMLIKNDTDYTVVERAAKGTGIDYWLGHNQEEPPFQNMARLEVSGILNGGGTDGEVTRAIDRRVREKIKQTLPSSGSLPAFVVVIEFGSPRGKVQKS